MAIKMNSFQITLLSPLNGKKVISVLEDDPDVRVCFSETLGMLKVDSEDSVDLEEKRPYAAITLVIAANVPVEKARTVAQRLQLRLDMCCH